MKNFIKVLKKIIRNRRKENEADCNRELYYYLHKSRPGTAYKELLD